MPFCQLCWTCGIRFVPQQEAWIIEKMGRYNKIAQPGCISLNCCLDNIAYVQTLKEVVVDIPQQTAVTIDNVTLHIDGILYYRVFDPYKASYEVQNPQYAVTQLAQTTMRSEIGKLSLDTVFREREHLNAKIIEALNKATDIWGILCMRYEIRDMKLPQRIQEAMQMQVEADRKKRAVILQSEGQRDSEINVADGHKRARILESEAHRQESINRAAGEAEAMLAKSSAKAESLKIIANAASGDNGQSAVAYLIAEQYISAFSGLAKTGNSMLIGSDPGDASQMIAKAMSIYNTVTSQPKPSTSARV